MSKTRTTGLEFIRGETWRWIEARKGGVERGRGDGDKMVQWVFAQFLALILGIYAW